MMKILNFVLKKEFVKNQNHLFISPLENDEENLLSVK